jgi:hypothetical protein
MKIKSVLAAVLPLVAVAFVLAPLLVDQPFGTQTPRTMMFAYALRRWSPLATVALAAGTIAAALGVARQARWWAKGLLILPVALALAAAWFARQNPFEWKFNALPEARYVAAGDATFVQPGDLVLAVSIDGDAAAYPIRQIAYHHVVNDRIGGTPAVVTY